MAKKESKEITVEEKLKTLYELQVVDTKIDSLRTLAGELPQEVKDQADELEGLKTRLRNIEEAIHNCESAMSDFRVKMENANALIARYKEQQNNVRNNREYDNLSKEIEYQELDIEAKQRKIKTAATDLEHCQEEKVKTVKSIEEKTFDLEQKKSELDSILQETKAETEMLLIRAADLEKLIDERLLTAFKRIRRNAHNGLAVVKVERDSCGGCHAKIPAQRQLDIRARKKILVCEFCGRILVDPDMEVSNKKK